MERLSKEELEAIRKRAEAADFYGHTSHFGEVLRQHARTDIPKLLAEIDRLDGTNERSVRRLTETVESLADECERLEEEVEELKVKIGRLEIENKTLEKVVTNQTVKIEGQSDFDWYVGY